MICSFWLSNAQKTVIQKSDLPKAAQEFLQSNFAKTDWAIGRKETKTRKVEYEITLADGTEIEFHENGEWKEIDGKGNPIPTNLVPKKISQYVMSNYPNEKVTKIEKKSDKIEIEFANDLELEFDNQENFLRID